MTRQSTPDPQFDFAGAQVVVTGGTSGIGHAVAGAFGQAGADVTVTGTRTSATDYGAELNLDRFNFKSLDVTDSEAIDGFAQGLDGLDVLVNNAGATLGDEADPDGFAASVQLNLLAAQRLSTRCHDLLAASDLPGGAAIVNVASMSANRPSRMRHAVSASRTVSTTRSAMNVGSDWRGVPSVSPSTTSSMTTATGRR